VDRRAADAGAEIDRRVAGVQPAQPGDALLEDLAAAQPRARRSIWLM
jgi:hypothetical protein